MNQAIGGATLFATMVKKMWEFQMLRGGKEEGYNPKLTAARAKLESGIEKLLVFP